jgi:putative transposase
MTFPKARRTQIYSTNPLKRLSAEIEAAQRCVGIFPNESSITRLVCAQLLEQKNEWQLQRRYMSLESLWTLSDN